MDWIIADATYPAWWPGRLPFRSWGSRVGYLRLHPSESAYQADKYDGPALRTFPWVRLYVGFITCTMTLTERGLWPQGHDQP